MTDRPYTDDDLRSAAALMHYAMTTEPNPADADAVLSGHPAWVHVEVGSDEEDQLRESVVELVSGAADVSAWAVNLGADGLAPSTEHEITINAGRPIARIHFAFEAGMPEEMRTRLVEGIGDAINAAGVQREDDGETSEACGKCRQPFDPADTRFDGRARHYLSPYCRGCVDRCHDNEIADHRCVICE